MPDSDGTDAIPIRLEGIGRAVMKLHSLALVALLAACAAPTEKQ